MKRETEHPVIDWLSDNAVPLSLGVLFGSAWTLVISLVHLLWFVML